MWAAARSENYASVVTKDDGRAILADVQRGMAAGELELYFQPIAAIGGGHIEALEALVRWNHPDHGLLAPASFLPIIERSWLAWGFSLHVLEQAVAQARVWELHGHSCRVAVNVSANLINARLVGELSQLLERSEIAPRRLSLEVTESAVMEDPVSATRALDRLADLGIGGVAIDDFGTGYSSLGRLRDLPIDGLKIDRSFVAELDRGVDPAFVRSVIDLAHYLELRVTAEGVEDEDTWRSLAHLGCDSGQGYWLSPPLPAAQALEWLGQHDAPTLAAVGRVGDRRRNVGRRTLDRIGGAFDRATEPMLVSDSAHRLVAVNSAARTLLRARSSALLDRHLDDSGLVAEGPQLTTIVESLAKQPHLTGVCTLALGDGTAQRIRYELRRSVIPGHHVWVLAGV